MTAPRPHLQPAPADLASEGAVLDLIFVEGFTGQTVIGIHDSELHRPQTIRIDQATLLRIRRGSKPRCYRVREKLAAIGVVWPVEAQPADPVASKKIGHCACGAALTRNRTVVLDGVAMCPACHRTFFGVGK